MRNVKYDLSSDEPIEPAETGQPFKEVDYIDEEWGAQGFKEEKK